VVSPAWKLFVEGGGNHNDAEQATRGTKTKGPYGKGSHAFKLLATLDPGMVRKAGPWAERFFSTLDRLTR
jgi:hypothetical protein